MVDIEIQILALVASALLLIWVASRVLAGCKAADAPRPEDDKRHLDRPRIRFDGVVHDQWGTRTVAVRGVNLNRFGALVVTREPLKPGALVYFDARSLRRMGMAQVRHCEPVWGGARYRIGLEFRGELMRSDIGNWRIYQGGQAPARKALWRV